MSAEAIEFFRLFALMCSVFVISGVLGNGAIKIAHMLGFNFEKTPEINTNWIERMQKGEVLHADNMFKNE
mgnify:CR=1 FL=1